MLIRSNFHRTRVFFVERSQVSVLAVDFYNFQIAIGDKLVSCEGICKMATSRKQARQLCCVTNVDEVVGKHTHTHTHTNKKTREHVVAPRTLQQNKHDFGLATST